MGLRLTPLRRDLLEMLALAQKPLGTYDIAERHGTQLERRAAPTIACRGLDFLVDIGLVTRLESQNAYVLCAYPDCLHDCMFLVCTSCDWVEEIVDQDVATLLENDAKHAGFVTERRVIEIQGQCKTCQPVEDSLVSTEADNR
ncbi:MAG: Fur family transcriptional regulator [Geminicoccaceae bacterium]